MAFTGMPDIVETIWIIRSTVSSSLECPQALRALCEDCLSVFTVFA
jgi:hypothetical protein